MLPQPSLWQTIPFLKFLRTKKKKKNRVCLTPFFLSHYTTKPTAIRLALLNSAESEDFSNSTGAPFYSSLDSCHSNLTSLPVSPFAHWDSLRSLYNRFKILFLGSKHNNNFHFHTQWKTKSLLYGLQIPYMICPPCTAPAPGLASQISTLPQRRPPQGSLSKHHSSISHRTLW